MPLTEDGVKWLIQKLLENPDKPYRMVKWYGEWFKGYFAGEPYADNEYNVEFEIGLTNCFSLRCEEPDCAIIKWAFINGEMVLNPIDVEYFDFDDEI